MRRKKIFGMGVEYVIIEGSKTDGSFMLFSIRSSDGSCSHAVTVCGGWIFDSNCKCAIVLSKENLDLCSGGTNEITGEWSTMLHVAQGYHFFRRDDCAEKVERKNIIKIMKRKRKKKCKGTTPMKKQKMPELRNHDIRSFFEPVAPVQQE
jgi:hypothetical protein